MKHALPPGSAVKGDFAHWKSLFGFLETNLKARGMEHCLEPTATPEEFNTYYENCKIVLQERAQYYFIKEGGVEEALERAVSTWARVISWGQINQFGTESDKQKNGPKSARNKERTVVFPQKRALKENVKCEDRQEKRAWKMALISDSGSSDSPSSAWKSDDSPSSRKSDN